MSVVRLLNLTVAIFATGSVALQCPAEVHYEWNYLNLTWPSAEQYHEAVADSAYIPKHNHMSGMKIYKDYVYLTIPRLRKGIPATLVRVPLKPIDGNRSPNAEPYPSWEMQKIGDCNALQFVLSVEIDPRGYMFLVDTGINDYLGDIKSLCPPRLLVLDLNDNGKIVLKHLFPKKVVNPTTSFLDDLVIDYTDGGYVYITNTDSKKPSMVVYSLKEKKSWSMSHKSMYADVKEIKVNGDNDTVTTDYGIDGIALSSASKRGKRLVYYSALLSRKLYSIPTDVLKKNSENFDKRVKLVGKKSSETDGMIMDANDELYFGLLSKNQVSKWNTRNKPFAKHQEKVLKDNVELMWQDSFAIDEEKNLWVTTNKLNKVINDHIDITQINYRLIKLAQLDYKNYMHHKDGTTPKLPKIC